LGDINELAGTAFVVAVYVKVIAHQVQEWGTANKITRAVYSVPITQRMLLPNEAESPIVVTYNFGVGSLVAWRHDDGNFFDACTQRFFDKNSRLLHAVPVN
jgi:hypothetical protein